MADNEAKQSTQEYYVSLAKNFAQGTHWRVGVQFERNVPQILDLTTDQVKEVEDDRYMEIRKAKAADKKALAELLEKRGRGFPAPKADDQAEASVDEDQSTEQEEAASSEDAPSEDSAEALARDSSINDLRAQAREAGIENVNSKTKIELATEIVDRQTDSEA